MLHYDSCSLCQAKSDQRRQGKAHTRATGDEKDSIASQRLFICLHQCRIRYKVPNQVALVPSALTLTIVGTRPSQNSEVENKDKPVSGGHLLMQKVD